VSEVEETIALAFFVSPIVSVRQTEKKFTDQGKCCSTTVLLNISLDGSLETELALSLSKTTKHAVVC